MIDFKAIATEIENEKGYCRLPNDSYATIPAIRRNCHTNEPKKVILHWRINNRGNQLTLEFIGGVTGWEEFYLEDMKKAVNDNQEIIWLCAGTKDRWDELYVLREDLEKIINTLLF